MIDATEDDFDDDLLYNYKMYKKRMPKVLLPIAGDSSGNMICISISGDKVGCVWFWDHEEEVYEGEPPGGGGMVMIREKDQHVVEVFKGVTRYTLACGKDMLMAKFVYKKGSRVPPHKHSYEQVTTILKGEQKIIIKSGEKRKVFMVKSGDSYIVPSNYEHEQIVLKESVTIDTWNLAP